MWGEFVVGSRPCFEGFSLGSPVFLPPEKPTFQTPIPPGRQVFTHEPLAREKRRLLPTL